MTSATTSIRVEDPVPAEQLNTITNLDNNSLIIRLLFTIHHLSRWLSPVHDPEALERSVRRGDPTPKDLVLRLRDYDQMIYPRMYLIANQNDPNLDTLPETDVSMQQRRRDQIDATIVVISQFRRLRQTSTSLLRALPDDAWLRRGSSRGGVEGSIRSMAEALAIHDYRVLWALDSTLDQVGAREGLAQLQVTPLEELLKLVPDGGVDIRV
jgi:hypothetical protein